MSDFNKDLHDDDFDKGIDFMMKRRKEKSSSMENSEASASSRPSSNPNFNRTPAGRVNTPPAANRQAVNRPVTSRPAAGRPTVNPAANRPAISHVSNRPATDKAVDAPTVNVPAVPSGTSKSTAQQAAENGKKGYMTSGQRIVPVDKSKMDPKRPITIKRTPDVPDNQATRKTDISDKVADKKSKKTSTSADNKNDVGGSLVISMVCAVIYIVFVIFVSAVISVFAINVGNDMYAFVKSDELIEVTIPENATTEDVAEILYQNGVIKYKGVFSFYGKYKKIEENYVAGDYTVSPMMNYKTLIYEFKPKRVTGTSWVTIPEGYTVDEIIDLLLSYEIGGSKEAYVEAINNGEFNYWFVEELETNGWSEDRFYRLEGYLFPDTYEFYNASDAYTVVNKMLKRFSEVYTEAYRARAEELGMTTDQVVTLASMIEKEAGVSSDFRNVSSVFHNRLNNSGTFPKLESDATVVYAIHHLTGERPSEVTGETISYVSPYNTYQNNGLPPGAIANPGMNALKYAIYPAETSYYYFVSSKSGTTLFATNNAGHEANKQAIKDEQ